MGNVLRGWTPTREEAVNEVKALYGVLSADVDAAKVLLTTATVDTQFARRSLVRAYFAYFEGMSFQLRQITLATHKGYTLLTPEEIAMLEEKSRLKLKCRLIQSLRYYATCHRPEPYEPNRKSPGWHSMTGAIKLRDRITHPKSASSLLISDSEHKQMLDAGQWWVDSVRELLRLCDEADAHFRQLGVSKWT